MRSLLLALVCLLLPVGFARAADVLVLSYTLDVRIQPQAGALTATGKIRLRAQPGTDHLAFTLHDTFTIRRLRIGAVDLATTVAPGPRTPTRPASVVVTAALPDGLAADEFELEIEYGGRLRVLPQFGTELAKKTGKFLDDAIEPTRVELAGYSTWYPRFGAYGTTFDHDVTFTLPAGWIVAATGEKTADETRGGLLRSRWKAAGALDIVCIASPAFKVRRVEASGAAVETYFTRLPDSFVERESQSMRRALELFTGILGPPARPAGTVRNVFSPREAGQGGYARSSLVVTSEGLTAASLQKNPSLSLVRGLAHETAHFWWTVASGQADWLNETFAEYFSLVALERLDSKAAFERALSAMTGQVAALPPDAPSLATVPATNEGDGYAIRYYKGSLMLHAFRTAMGDAAFFGACRDFYQAFALGGATTPSARDFWRRRLGAQSALVDLWFNTRGAIPGQAESR